jgi:hypothetical protein
MTLNVGDNPASSCNAEKEIEEAAVRRVDESENKRLNWI